MKTAINILSDPKSNSEESLGRLFNALIFARESVESGDEVAIVFTGTGTRWPAELVKPSHPANALYDSVRAHVMGASRGCASVFGASESVAESGVPLLDEFDIPGVGAVASLRGQISSGWNVTVF